MREFKYQQWEDVQKRKGYRFPGKIVARYWSLKGCERYVVECVASGAEGCQHIFAPEQLRRRRK